MDFVVTFYNGEYPQLYPEELIKNLKAQDKTQNRAQDNIEERILNFCKEEKNIFEIMEYLGYKNRTRFRRDHIQPLVQIGKLKMTIPDKPTSRNQKYIRDNK